MLEGVYLFLDEKGNRPVEEFILALPIKEQAKILAYITELKNQGHKLHRPVADYLGNGIYELRPRDNRIFYFFFLKDSAVLVHAIKKKTDKIPKTDLKLCIKRKEFVEKYLKLKRLYL